MRTRQLQLVLPAAAVLVFGAVACGTDGPADEPADTTSSQAPSESEHMSESEHVSESEGMSESEHTSESEGMSESEHMSDSEAPSESSASEG